MNPNLEDINYPERGTAAKLIYKLMIGEDDSFLPIMGKNEKELTIVDGKYAVTGQAASFPMFNSNHYLFIEDGKPKGFFAIKEDRVDYVRREILNIHLLYVDKKYQRQGVAKRMLERLKHYADIVNGMCKRRESYFTRVINERYFSLSVYPNLFDWRDGQELDLQSFVDGEPEYDFTVSVDDEGSKKDRDGYYPADLHMEDMTYGLGKFTKRITQRKLREFYEGMGFVQCDELQFTNPIENGIVKREVNVSSGTLCNMNKTPMIYPDNNSFIEIVTNTMKPYFHWPINEEMISVFTKDVADALDEALSKLAKVDSDRLAG
jgi:GNAT superfamily N-acetyltransferase